MEFLKAWGDLIAPDNGFSAEQLWQVLAVLLLVAVNSRLLATRPGAGVAGGYGPLLWLRHNRGFVVSWLIIAAAFGVAQLAGQPLEVFRFFFFLGLIWFFIGLATSFVREKFWSESIALLLYLLTGLAGLALVDETIAFLNDMSLTMGSLTITAGGVLAGLLAFGLTLWLSLAAAKVIESQLPPWRCSSAKSSASSLSLSPSSWRSAPWAPTSPPSPSSVAPSVSVWDSVSRR